MQFLRGVSHVVSHSFSCPELSVWRSIWEIGLSWIPSPWECWKPCQVRFFPLIGEAYFELTCVKIEPFNLEMISRLVLRGSCSRVKDSEHLLKIVEVLFLGHYLAVGSSAFIELSPIFSNSSFHDSPKASLQKLQFFGQVLSIFSCDLSRGTDLWAQQQSSDRNPDPDT